MVLTNSERQQLYKERKAKTHKMLNLLLPNASFELLATNATAQKLTKVGYVESLLMSNTIPLVSNENFITENLTLKAELKSARKTIEGANAEVSRLNDRNTEPLIGNDNKDELIESLNNKIIFRDDQLKKCDAEISTLTIKAAGRDNENLIAEIDGLRIDIKNHLRTIHGLKAEIKSIKCVNSRGVEAVKTTK